MRTLGLVSIQFAGSVIIVGEIGRTRVLAPVGIVF